MVWGAGAHAGVDSVVGSETVRFRTCWSWLGCVCRDGGTGSERGMSLGAGGVVADMRGTGGGGTTRFGGIWGKLGGWDKAWGCSDESSVVFRCFEVAARGPEWGRAGGSVVIDGRVLGDVAVALGVSWVSTKVGEASWGEQGGVEG
jgi:hypothetical protein